jgi:shikimate kinase
MTRSANRLFLVGPMGAGKTTIGRQLARRLGRRFIDSDQALEARTGVDIPTIFDIEGESGFRNREAAILDELSREPDIVLATGGGAILRPENRACLSERGTVIYLRADVATQLRRTARSNRPLLQTDDPRARLSALFAERDPLYRAVADLIIDSGGGSIGGVISQIIDHLDGNPHDS